MSAPGSDRLLMATMAGLIESARARAVLDPGDHWRPGEPLRLLMAGYSGARNTGADARVEEMLRQIRHLLGDAVALSVLTIDPEQTRGYFQGAEQLHLPLVFPAYLARTVRRFHGVVACEGSMFKSRFANALSTMMVGALGLATAEGKLAIGYGGEAGRMDPSLEAMVRRYCGDAQIIARNTASVSTLGALGISAHAGTDTAWTLDVPTEPGQQVLRAGGWDGAAPVVAICPINPFWWPVRPDVGRGLGAWLTGRAPASRYRSIYFHRDDDEVRRKQRRYLSALADGARRFQAETGAFVVLVGMEAVDRRAVSALADHFPRPPLQVVSDTHDVSAMVSLLRSCDAILSSRYHALVCSMPAQVPSAGVSMDERIANLMDDRGSPSLCLSVDDPDLAERTYATLRHLRDEAAAVRAQIGRSVARNLRVQGEMGRTFLDIVRARHPELPIRPALQDAADPLAFLPPLSAAHEALLAAYPASASA